VTGLGGGGAGGRQGTCLRGSGDLIDGTCLGDLLEGLAWQVNMCWSSDMCARMGLVVLKLLVASDGVKPG
jgi:hypothetical protein